MVQLAKLISTERISLRNHPEIKEDTIQNYIFENPSVLGLGDLTAIRREKVQPSGGRLDILLTNDDNTTRYEVEIQLGATDPSHIIRTLEYWDMEKKRYPQYDHCAVIVAEEITGRFMNVISLFNGAIPLIAIQMSAFKTGEDVSLSFIKVLDRITYATDEEESFEVTDRNYWENRSTPAIMKSIDAIYNDIKEYAPGYEFKYNKFYIGLTNNGVVKNFVFFKPKKKFFYLLVKGEIDATIQEEADAAGLEIDYSQADKNSTIRVKLNSHKDYLRHKELLDKLIKNSMKYFNITE